MKIDTSKIKAGDEVQIANGDWYPFSHYTKSGGKAVIGEHGKMISVPVILITDHRPAEPELPKGWGHKCDLEAVDADLKAKGDLLHEICHEDGVCYFPQADEDGHYCGVNKVGNAASRHSKKDAIINFEYHTVNEQAARNLEEKYGQRIREVWGTE